MEQINKKCRCGCGEFTMIGKIHKKFNDYIHGHNQKGKKFTDEHRKKLSIINSGKNNVMYGKHHTEKTKEKMSLSSKGVKHPLFGKKRSQEIRDKISKTKLDSGIHKGKNNSMYGKHHSEETRKK